MKSIKKILRFVVVLLVLSISGTLLGQTDSLQIHKINNKEYYIHIVEKGGSLYAIHKKYNVPIDVIKRENPNVLDGLSIGEEVLIPIKKNTDSPTKVDGNHIYHKVLKKQTLYAIAKLYQLKQKEILIANPDLSKDMLQEGTIIKIPVSKIKKENNDNSVAIENSIYKTHLIKKGETLYSLSKLYNVKIDSIKIVNNGLKKGLKKGSTIFLPIVKKDVSKPNPFDLGIDIENVLNDSASRKPIYRIGLLLPFYLDENSESEEQQEILSKRTIYPRSKFALEFFNGFTMALDTLTSDSAQIELYVYDTKGKDSLRINEILLQEELRAFDLIVGPLYSDNFEEVAAFAKTHQIPIVSPVKQNNKVLLGNEYVFKAIPSKTTTISQIVTLVTDSFKTDNLIALDYEKSEKRSLTPLFVKSYNNKLLQVNDTLTYSTIKTLSINLQYNELINNLKKEKNNVIFVPVTDKTFVTNLFNYLVTVLSKEEYEDYEVTVIGLEEWLGYDNIDLEYFQRLNVYLPVNRYVNFEDSITNSIIERYVQLTGTYPSKNALLGYDISNFFGNCLVRNGTVLNQTIPSALKKGIALEMNFFKTGLESGYENNVCCILKFDNYTLRRIY